jgi:hypothetical protein
MSEEHDGRGPLLTIPAYGHSFRSSGLTPWLKGEAERASAATARKDATLILAIASVGDSTMMESRGPFEGVPWVLPVRDETNALPSVPEWGLRAELEGE